MKFNKLLEGHNDDKPAIITGEEIYTYGDIRRRSMEIKEPDGGIWVIKENSVLDELVCFLAADQSVPVIAFEEYECLPQEIPDGAEFAVLSSGTTGTPKLIFRTVKSWYDFFEIQNKVFSICSETVLFIQGSLCFPGNLNMLLGALYTGATIVMSKDILSRKKIAEIEKYKVDTIYMIPDKLRVIAKLCSENFSSVKTIISGSQSMGKADAERLRKCFGCQSVILYYGASETSYVSYLDILLENRTSNCIGKPFPTVQVHVDNGRLQVDSAYVAIGREAPFTLNDMVHLDNEGYLYFDGRFDDVLNVGGEKFSATALENEIKEVEYISDACVFSDTAENGREILCCAYCTDAENISRVNIIKDANLTAIPKKWYQVKSIAKYANGKTDRNSVKKAVWRMSGR